MSKMDGLRAMREARYQERTNRTTTPARPAAKPAAAPTAQRATAPEPAPAAPAVQASSPELCGHRAISGKTCTREHGHASKSHRYS